MEYCHGSTLAEVIATGGPMGEAAVRPILGQLATALKYIHGRGVIHSDLKPSNVMLNESGSIKLLDFGIVRFDRESQLWNATRTRGSSDSATLLGTPRYMAPEQFSGGTVDRRTDFYGLACVAFEALSGRPVLRGSDFFTIIREQTQFVLPAANQIGKGVSDEMYEVLTRGLERAPDKRALDLDRLTAWSDSVHHAD
jgi:serine/threonine-protein kinase